MFRLLTSVFLLAALAGPALANNAKPLTVKAAKFSAQQQATDTLGTLLYRSVGAAPVTVSGCRVKGQYGTCKVVVTGTSRCQYVAHVHLLAAGAMTWGEGLRCS